ncbi:MAG: AraC family transcriptional regulator [Gammaproteobacteria bacterium]|nr:AraC family transcriptional regulator [Gammaproteobacteria bacterium]
MSTGGVDYARLQEPGARYSYAAVCRLWGIAEEGLNDPGFGPRVASLWHPTTMHALGDSWMASYDLDEAYRCTIHFLQFKNSSDSYFNSPALVLAFFS